MRTPRLAAVLSPVLAAGVVIANVATPFGVSAKSAPLIVVARCERLDDKTPVLRTLEVVKGDPALRGFALQRPEWLYRPLESGGVYLIQFDLEQRPWVGGLTADPDPEQRVPGHGCGTVNVMRIVDGYVHDFYSFVTKLDGSRVSLDEAKKNLDLLN